MGAFAPIFVFMRAKTMAQGAILAALYTVLTLLQNMLLPGSASMPIQVRVAESLCVLAFFTPAAVPGLTLGCFLVNLMCSSGMALDLVLGTLATFLSVQGMRLLRKWPLPALLLPVLCNAGLVGLTLRLYVGGGFWLNAGYVAAGEALAMVLLGLPLMLAIRGRKLQDRLF